MEFDLDSALERVSNNKREYVRDRVVPPSKRCNGIRKTKSGRWQAYIMTTRGWHHIGMFDTEQEAFDAREEFRKSKKP
jgi:hypothetical protein